MLRNRTYSKRASASASDGRIQAYGTSSGLYLSQDYGATWSQIYTNGVSQVLFTKNSILIISYGGGVYQSFDNGQNWLLRISGLQFKKINVSSNGNNVCVVKSNDCYISTDEGETFTFTSNSEIMNAYCFNDGRVLTITRDGYSTVSINIDGVTKLSISSKVVYSIATSSNELYIAVVIGGIYLSSDGGNTFSKTNYSDTTLRCMAMSDNARYITAPSYSSKYVYTSNDYGTTWEQISTSMSNLVQAAMSGDGKYQLLSCNGNFNILASSDYGATWTKKNTDKNVYCVAIK